MKWPWLGRTSLVALLAVRWEAFQAGATVSRLADRSGWIVTCPNGARYSMGLSRLKTQSLWATWRAARLQFRYQFHKATSQVPR